MFRTLLASSLIALATLSAAASPDRPDRDYRRDERRDERRDDRREDRRDDREDRRHWKEHDKAERKYWKERDKEARKYERHRYEDDRRHGHHVPPPWMNGYWRPEEHRRYVALVPGDPSRMYVFLEGRWVLRQVRDPRARLDLEGAFRLPVAPPPVAPPRIGVDLHVVLFN